MYYDYITSKDYENEDYKDILFKYIKQEEKYRSHFNNYINRITKEYEKINKKQPVKITNIQKKEE